jgi:hypothetical protein
VVVVGGGVVVVGGGVVVVGGGVVVVVVGVVVDGVVAVVPVPVEPPELPEGGLQRKRLFRTAARLALLTFAFALVQVLLWAELVLAL